MVLCVLEERRQATKFAFSAMFIHFPVSQLKKKPLANGYQRLC